MKSSFIKLTVLCCALVCGITVNAFAVGCFVLKDLSGGEYHTLAVDDSNSLWACGDNSLLQLGLGNNVYSTNVLQQVFGENGQGYLEDIVDFDAGWVHSLAADADGTIWAWGTDDYGQLGNGDGTGDNSAYPAKVLGVGGTGYLTNIVALSAGRSGTHSLAVDADGYVYAWGNNISGQCGNGTAGNSIDTPIEVLDDDPGTTGVYLGDIAAIIAVDAGVAHSMALDEDGYVWQWGDSISPYLPEKVSGENGVGDLENIIAIASCYVSLALDSSGYVWLWDNGYPEKVPGGGMQTQYLENITAIGAGSNYGMALDANGRVWVFDSSSPSPAIAPDGQMQTDSGYLENIAVIDAGFTHKLTIDHDGNGWAWGGNSSGDLGTGSVNSELEPAAMIAPVIDALIGVVKEDDVTGQDCVTVNDTLIYTITIDPNGYDHQWVTVTDYLPQGITYDYLDMQTLTIDPNYSMTDHTYTWCFGPLLATDSPVVLTLEVTVNTSAEPGGELVNEVIVRSDITCAVATKTTPVCCWGGDVIYVDQSRPDGGNGVSWQTAYRNLQSALSRAANGCGSEIWVANAMYSPGADTGDSFEIPDGVAVYGGFAGYETSRQQRNWKQHETILSGYISESVRNNVVVAIGDGCILDGFTVEEGGYTCGIDASGGTSTIANSIIKNNNTEEGIYCSNGNLTVSWCEIMDNGKQGIYHWGSGYSLVVDNCKIHDNQRDGILTEFSNSTILNSLIYQNGSGSSYYGVNLSSPPTGTLLRNNTIVHNANEGIRRYSGSVPIIKNCILYYNNVDEDQLSGITCEQITYCCISDCNEVNDYHNVKADPDFAYAGSEPNTPIPAGNYHLTYNSPCVNAGDGDSYPDEMDMDGEDRVYDVRVEIGADEVTCMDIVNENDWNADGLINLYEFSVFSRAWLAHDPNDPVWLADPNLADPNLAVNWNPVCNLDDSVGDSQYVIDLSDFIVFCQNWGWKACWYEDEYLAMYAMSSGGENLSMAASMLEFSSMESAIPMEMAVEETPVIEEKSIEEQILDLEDTIDFLEQIWLDEPDLQQEISSEDWQEFMDSVYQNLLDLQAENNDEQY